MGYMGKADRFSYRFIAALTESIAPTGSKDANSIRRSHAAEVALRGINNAEYKIASGLQTIRSRAEMIETKLDNGYRLNDLGEFQGIPAEVDQAIVARQSYFDVLAVLLTEDELEHVMAEAKTEK